MVALGRYYGCKVETCVPYDPESKGGVEATVKIAKADLVPSDASLLPAYGSFAELQDACREFSARFNGRVHRETAAVGSVGSRHDGAGFSTACGELPAGRSPCAAAAFEGPHRRGSPPPLIGRPGLRRILPAPG
jgi:hypothetical protein